MVSCLFLFLIVPLPSRSQDTLVPAGTILECTTSDKHISSKNTDLSDPVLCSIHKLDAYGRSVLPYGSSLGGYFDEAADPGHFVGKGWMVLTFDRLIIAPGTIILVTAKVIDVPRYNVDRDGKIDGQGHTKRDIVMWMIPILWPIDLLELPRRGPRPSLRAETRISVKLMEDVSIPEFDQTVQYARAPGLIERSAQPEPQQYQQQ